MNLLEKEVRSPMSFPEEQLPREFGKYHLIEKVATGGMAELFRAKLYGAGGFEKDLAVKKILPQLGQDQDFIQMFMDEAMITVTLNHGNIAQVLDFGEINGEYFLVMEYVDGVDLQNLLKRITEENEPIPTELAAYIVQEICKGLDYAHHKLGIDGQPLNIVHRDVSPQNVIISFEGQVKLVDFGIARAASRITSTQAGVVKGKMDYMSPEQLLGKGVDSRSDIWAAGVIFYELLTLKKPFMGQTPQETMAAITRGTYKAPQKINKQVDRKLAAVLKKALESNTKKRYQTAGKMAQSIASYLHSTKRAPSPLALAQLLRQRLPYAKPRTLNPTPVEIKHRQEHQRSAPPATPVPESPTANESTSVPPAVSVPESAASAGNAFASAPEQKHRNRTTAPEFPKAGSPPIRNEAPAKELQVSEQKSAVAADGGEAISFSDLGLPGQYEGEPPGMSKQASIQEQESLDFDDATLVQPTIIEPDDTTEPDSKSEASPPESQEPIAELAAAAAQILSDAPVLDIPSSRESVTEQPAPLQSRDDSLASYDEDLHNAATTLRSADEVLGNSDGTDTANKPQQVIEEEQWLEHTPEQQGPDFDDEAPSQAKKSSGAIKAMLVFILVIVILGLTLAFVWNPFGPGSQSSTSLTPVAIKPIGHKQTDHKPTPPAQKPKSPLNKPNHQENKPDKDLEVANAKPAISPVPAQVKLDEQDRQDEAKQGKDVTQKPAKAVDSHKINQQKKPVKKKNKTKKHKSKRIKRPGTRIAKVKGVGILKINSEPFSVVYWKGKRLGPTPQMNIKLPAGSHTLELKNEALGLSRRVRVRIEPNKVQTVFVELKK